MTGQTEASQLLRKREARQFIMTGATSVVGSGFGEKFDATSTRRSPRMFGFTGTMFAARAKRGFVVRFSHRKRNRGGDIREGFRPRYVPESGGTGRSRNNNPPGTNF